jgi:hypothetical protein
VTPLQGSLMFFLLHSQQPISDNHSPFTSSRYDLATEQTLELIQISRKYSTSLPAARSDDDPPYRDKLQLAVKDLARPNESFRKNH